MKGMNEMKKQIRKQMIELRKGQSPEFIEETSKRICERISGGSVGIALDSTAANRVVQSK